MPSCEAGEERWVYQRERKEAEGVRRIMKVWSGGGEEQERL